MQHAKTILTVGSLFVIAGALAACQPKVAAPGANGGDQATEKKQAGGTNMMEMAAAIMKGEGFRCTFTQKENGQAMSYAIKGKKVSMTTTGAAGAPGQMGRMITDGTVMHIWDPATKKGMKMTIPSPDPKASNVPTPVQAQVPDFSDIKSWQDFQSKYDVNCTPTQLNDSEFTPPTDVQFQDLSGMMKKLPAGVPTAMPTALPSGMPAYQR